MSVLYHPPRSDALFAERGTAIRVMAGVRPRT